MKLYQITPQDHRRQVVAPINLAELKALHNALAVDVATGGGTTPGVDLDALLAKMEAIIQQSRPPSA
jgi:dihydroxyacid dehydratase/phosphogluconate dehydratase